MWEPQPQPKRGPRPTLTVEAIAGAGIVIADAEGLAAVTMQRVAERLGVTKMALYRYVPGKSELVAIMIDLAIGGPPDAAGRTWRTKLDGWARALFDRFCRHPWAIEATVGPRIVGPQELSWLEQAVAALSRTALTGGEKLDVAVLLTGHVRNLAQQITALPTTGAVEHAMESAFQVVLAGREERFPALTEALASAAASGEPDQALDFGLARILDGIQALIRSRGA
ncbi:MAG: TetR/AcrR family transcriptional regulator [Hamadaea sp.]|nr:TetR/AcrR family transcriptional regulator [Hamadaea sp.]